MDKSAVVAGDSAFLSVFGRKSKQKISKGRPQQCGQCNKTVIFKNTTTNNSRKHSF